MVRLYCPVDTAGLSHEFNLLVVASHIWCGGKPSLDYGMWN